MKVTLISHTQDAAELLIFTKGTRLNMSPDGLEDIKSWSSEKKKKELDYMSNTIKSSWEFVDYTFMIEGVSRAFTHQFVRNRMGSYAQQTMRMLDVSGFDYVAGPSLEGDNLQRYDDAMATINAEYEDLIECGAKVEDARGVLPTNICTNIVAKYNLRTLSDMFASRRSLRTQSEFRSVAEAMEAEVLRVHPWAATFLRDRKADALKQLESVILSEYEGTEMCTDYLKLIDTIRNS